MHTLNCLHDGPHLYGPGGRGYVEFDPAPLASSEKIVETRDLPGFVSGNTTYESHHFWIHFCRYARQHPTDSDRFSSVLIRIHHGGGWEVWRGDYMLAEALRRFGPDDIGAFLMCWFLWDSAQSAHIAGYDAAKAEYQRAFVDGRLKKRKLPAQGKVKVWIEPTAAAAQPAMFA